MRLVHQDAGWSNLFDRAPMHSGIAERGRGAQSAAVLHDRLPRSDRAEQTRHQPWLFAALRGRLIDSRGAINKPEQAKWVIGRFRRSDEQKTAGIERVVKRVADLFLQLAVE